MSPHQQYTPEPPKPQYVAWPRPFLISARNLSNYSVCPAASSLVGTLPDDPWNHLVGIACRTWSCAFCARQKIRLLAVKTGMAQPNRLLTLTVDPSLYNAPRDAFEVTSPLVTELIRALRKRFGPIEYLRVTEVTKQGYPHYHMLLRSDFLPHPVVKKIWSDLTKASIVDLRQVHKTFGAFNYLVKYLTKMHRLEWTERHVSYSRAFFPREEKKGKAPNSFLTMKRDHGHPHDLMVKWYNGKTLTQLGPMHWLLNAEPSSLVGMISPPLHPRSYDKNSYHVPYIPHEAPEIVTT